jgi:hypothetical protein
MNAIDELDLKVLAACGHVADVAFVISTVLFPVVIYMIICHSASMGKYKW